MTNEPLQTPEAAQLIEQVAEAIQVAHEHDVIHRDLKPQNILLTKAGQPKVTDFGLAKLQNHDAGLTNTGDVFGTPSYMAPEQAKGQGRAAGVPADIYSLGATLYCLLTGRPPFQSANAWEVVKDVIECEPVSPRVLNSAIPRDLETICLRCMQKNPEHGIPGNVGFLRLASVQ